MRWNKTKKRGYICAHCKRPIPPGEEMTEKINGKWVHTHRDCPRYFRYAQGSGSLDDMIHEALDGGPGNQIRKRRYGG